MYCVSFYILIKNVQSCINHENVGFVVSSDTLQRKVDTYLLVADHEPGNQ